MTDTTHRQIERADLQHFHDLPAANQSELMDAATDYFRREGVLFESYARYPHLSALEVGILDGKLVPVLPDENFGIVSPIRGRYDISHLSDEQASIPYLAPIAYQSLRRITEQCKQAAIGHGLMSVLTQHGINDFRFALTSLTRSSYYQTLIAKEGRFVVRDMHGQPGSSVHETGHAFDIDHGGLYVTRASDGLEVAINQRADDNDFEILRRVLPITRQAQQEVVEAAAQAGEVFALHEIPNGWGVWHVTVPNGADQARLPSAA